MKKSLSQTKRTSEKYKTPTSPRKNSVHSSVYFCHYKNGMYMGGINAFQRHGRGIIIHDEGVSGIVNYYNDLKHGHNVYLMENCIISAEFNKNKVKEGVFRVPGYLLYAKYNKDEQLDGRCILMNYSTKNIIYTTFRKGTMIDKNEEQQYAIINKVFDLDNLEFLIGRLHSKVLKLEMEKDENILTQKLGNKLSVGFVKKGLMNGLGFAFSIKAAPNNYNPDTHRNQDDFSIKPLERGYYANSQLQGLGQKHFKNGNIYVGDFKGDIFEGNGVLKNTLKNNWVSGYFQRGNMAELFEYSHDGEVKKFYKIVETMHERKINWINKQIRLVDPEVFLKQIENIMNSNPTSQLKTLEIRKREVLKKIQDNFICDSPRDSPLASSRNIQSYHEIQADSNIKQPNPSSFRMKGFNTDERSSSKRESGDIVNEEIQRKLEESRNARESSVKEKTPNKHSYSTGLIKLKEIPVDSTKRIGYSKGELRNPSRSRSRLSQNIYERRKSSDRNSSPSFNLDSKRIIGKSRIFKYLNPDSEQNPPQFNYNLQ